VSTRRRLRIAVIALATAVLAPWLRTAPAPACEHGGGPPPRAARPATLVRGLGDLHHPIATASPEAQRFFDQGLRFVYAFNHDEAVRSFTRAAELDPKAPMPMWGVALALGPNINLDVDPAREQEAYAAVQKARVLAAARAEERAYVDALALRYSDDPGANLKSLAATYAGAMRDLAARYPDDLDAATLFAESMMDLRPWQLWSADGRPAEGTEEIVATLERVLQRDPHHLGANHYYVHAVEASPHPERALPSAARLATLAPAAGHVVHMPAHVYMRTGDYVAASRANAAAAEADRAYLRNADPTGVYPLLYYSHNLQFLAASRAMAGESKEAERAAAAVVANISRVPPEGALVPMLDYFAPTPYFVALRFQRWDALARMPAPDPRLPATTALWHFTRAVAFSARGDRVRALAERDAFDGARALIPGDALLNLNRTDDILGVARATLDARLAAADDDGEAAIGAWRVAVERADALAYDEPPAWYCPVRESLGAALHAAGRPAEAEAVFREDLRRHPRNPRALFGLREALRAQGKVVAADTVDREFRAAWTAADVPLTLRDF
jgi:tetratricopeptide (TPR) repeat protein